MPLLHNYVFDEIFVPVVFLFLLVSGIFATGLGVSLVVFGDRVFRKFGPMNRWVSIRKNIKPMETAHDIEPLIHKYRRQFGAIFIIGGAFTIFMLTAKVDAAAVASVFGARKFSFIGPWVVQSLATFLIVGSVLAIAIGIILGFVPHLLAAVESRTNHWYSSRQIVTGADTMHLPLDRWFKASPRVAGWTLAVAALFLTVSSVLVLLGHR
jgi:hypothetical protein